MAPVRQCARLPGLYVGAPREKAVVHGTENRPARRVEQQFRHPLGAIGIRPAPQATDFDARTQPALPRQPVALPDASAELRELVEIIDAPAVTTLMGLGALPSNHPNFVSMPGMHGSYAANMGMLTK